MHNKWVLTGKVVSGSQRAAFFTQLDWVQTQCEEKLGFKPYPGTLNLEIAEESLPIVEALQKEKGIALVPPDPKFCVAKVLVLTVGSFSGAIIIPAEDVRVHGKRIIEVIAPLRLKDALNVDDGDPVKLVIGRPAPQKRAE
jgi:CTP-dependent riboflavin kinase